MAALVVVVGLIYGILIYCSFYFCIMKIHDS